MQIRSSIVLALGLIAAVALAGDEPVKTGLYPLDTCPLSGKKLGADAVVYDYQGRELRFPSKEVVETFKKDPEGSLAKIDAAIIRQQLPGYPLDVCPVSGDKLGGDMGEPLNKVYQNRLVRFCCKSCLPEFQKDPAKFMAKIDAAIIAKQKPSYPLDICVVTNEKLGADEPPLDYVFGARLVRFCCKDCVKEFAKDPAKFVAKIDEASGKK